MSATPDAIEKQTLLNAPLERVWQALTEAARFGYWFGAEFDGEFAAGAELRGRITPTRVDEEVAALQAPHDGVEFVVRVEDVEPMTKFSFRWHPYAVDPDSDLSAEPTTLVTFTLAPTADGVLLTVTESGFQGIPLERRAAAFEANEGGWALQGKMIGKYLKLAA